MEGTPGGRVTIREAREEDVGDLARLNALFNDSREPPERYAERLRDPARVDTPLLACLDGRAVGFANLRVVPEVFYPTLSAELTELYVEEAWRGLGIGGALVQYAEQLARAAGAERMVIITDFENLPAQRLYERLGYADRDLALRKRLGAG